MITILSGIFAAFLSAFLFVKFKDITDSDKESNRYRFWFGVSFIIYTIADIFTIFFMRRSTESVLDIILILILVNFLFLLAFIDFKHKLIPNRYITTFIIIGTFLLFIKGIVTGELLMIMFRAFIGAVAGFAALGIVSLVSGRGLGAGDIKMYAAIGYFTGCMGVLDILIYSTIFCSITGLLLVAIKKCTMKSFIPMAPFAFAGMMTYIFLNF